jgi:hypothetical protein
LLISKKFRAGQHNVLVATCIAEEGLDIGEVDLIICFDAHSSPTRLVQRMGRTGRARRGRCGKSLLPYFFSVLLMSAGREEQKFSKAEYKKKDMFELMKKGNGFKMYTHNPRMLPPAIHPVLEEVMVQVQAPVAPAEKLRGPRFEPSPSHYGRRAGGAANKPYQLTPEEAAFARHYSAHCWLARDFPGMLKRKDLFTERAGRRRRIAVAALEHAALDEAELPHRAGLICFLTSQ